MSAMCAEFGCELNTSRHNGRTYYIFALSSIAQLALLTAYLDRHPLLSAKFLDYSDWRLAHMLIRENKHLTAEGAALIRGYKSGINNSRTIYTWDHLSRPRE